MLGKCKEHISRISECNQCFESTVNAGMLLKESKMIDKELKGLKTTKNKLKEKLREMIRKMEDILLKKAFEVHLPPEMAHKSLKEYLINKPTSNSIFDVIKSQEESISFMLKTGLYVPQDLCECGQHLCLVNDPNLNDYSFLCTCSKRYGFFDRSVWEPGKLPADKILLYIILWIMGTRDKDIKQILNIRRERTAPLQSLLQNAISNNFQSSLPKFSGTVEIDESCFKNPTTKTCKTQPDKWVFGLYERERKLTYMEVVSKRTASYLIPIIQKICEQGTTIISDQWSAYNKLVEFGFPHYTVDHSRFFVNPLSREIHTQHIEISWCWAKYEIKRQHRQMGNLQKLLDVFCWKRQFKNLDKATEIGDILSNLCKVMREYQNEKLMMKV
ncbi:hypothetical protein SteCoe_12210 [Stentor coeruleus]|uniref:ISXO2-like transposase domain-containing protein n=1 Tax=Stentor coeruleus TaxID=5963 RepID=A0A1R2CBB5_9CILI|nr:hypothetical protein SteCoe_12210 [Stentor coeruleus]